MLSIAKLTAAKGGAAYYENQVASGLEDYYAGAGEAKGRWIGGGAADLELDGEVGEGELQALVGRGEHPISGEALRRGRPGGPLTPGRLGVQGFDLTFSAPKSVSVLFGVPDIDTALAVRDGHDAAVRQALGYLERQACLTRLGRNGVIRQRARGFVAAAFRHRSSRAGDPQLHTHVVVANLAQADDGRWRTLDGRALYEHCRTAGFLYRAALRDQLTVTLGVEWTDADGGLSEIAGVPDAVLERFSTRRAEIVRALEEAGASGAAAAEAAALRTRRSKDRTVDAAGLRGRWQAEAAELGFGPAQAADVLGRTARAQPDRQRVMAWLAGEGEGITAHASTFTRKEVLRGLAERFHQGLPVADLERLADGYLASDRVVEVDDASPCRNDTTATTSGVVVGDAKRYSTRAMLAVEERLLTEAVGRRGRGAGTAEPLAVDQAIARRPTLAGEQTAMVRRLCGSGNGVEVVRAPAGSGKTYALDACKEAWQASGVPVFGCALSAQAAGQLRDAGIPASTIARLETDIANGHGLPRGGVLIVDEAGMVGTRTLARLAHHAAQADAKLVLVGDDRQLPEIDAGGAFRALADRLQAVELTANHRQQHDWDRQALARLRDGSPADLLDAYQAHERITVSPTLDETRQALVRDWWHAANDVGTDQAVMIAMRRDDVYELNQHARTLMRDAGALSDTELDTGHRRVAVGDRIIARHNDQRVGIRNGDRGHITHLHEDASVDVELDDGRQLTLPPRYVTGRRPDHQPYLDHGYATTAHALQGATVERAFIAGGEDTYREWAYTALTRHREEARFYTTAPDAPTGDQLAPLARAMSHTRAKHLAHDTPPALGHLTDEQLRDERRRLRDLLADHPTRAVQAIGRIDARLQEIAAQLEPPPRRRLRRPPSPSPAQAALRAEHAHLQAVRQQIIHRTGDPDTWMERHRDELRRLGAIEAELAGRSPAVPGRDRPSRKAVQPSDLDMPEIGIER